MTTETGNLRVATTPSDVMFVLTNAERPMVSFAAPTLQTATLAETNVVRLRQRNPYSLS